MLQIEIDNQELINYMESLSYDVAARRDVITFMLANGMDTNSEQFRDYHKEYMESFAKLETAKAQIEKDYVLPNSKGRVTWSLDYGTAILTITEITA